MGEIEYARTEDGAHIAFRVLDASRESEPGHDIVMVSGGLFPMEVFDEDPGFARLLEGLQSLGRVIVTVSVLAAISGQVAAFEPVGPRELKGVPGTWELFRLTAEAANGARGGT